MRTRARKILRDIWSRKGRTLLVSISIFIGVFGTVTLFTMGDLVVNQLEKDLEQDKLAMIRAYLAVPPQVEPDNAAVLSSLRNLPGVTTVEGQGVAALYWKKTGNAGRFNQSTLLSYSETFDAIQLEPPHLIKGAFPVAGEQQLALERRFADKHDLKVGDTLTVRVVSATASDETAVPEETWTVSGIVFFAYGYSGDVQVLPEDSLFATFDDMRYLTNAAGFSSVYLRYRDFPTAKALSDDLNPALARTGAYIPTFTFVEDPAENGRLVMAETSGNVMASLALLALFVSGFLVFNMLMSIITEQQKQIGVMKVLGASRWDNFVIYSGMALTYGLAGVIAGVGAGIPMGFLAAKGFGAPLNAYLDEFAYSSKAIVLGVVVGLAVPVIASLPPVFNGTRVKIIDAITDFGIAAQYGSGPVARLVNRLPVPIVVRQGISNVLRKKGRMMLTGFTLMLAAGAFMGVFAVFASVDVVLEDFFGTYDYHLAVLPNDPHDLPAVEAIIAGHSDDWGLTAKGDVISLAISIDGFDKEFTGTAGPPALFANGYDPTQGAFQLKLVVGEDLIARPDGVILSRMTTDYSGWDVGDMINIHAGGRSGTFQIVGIAAFPYDGVWFHWTELAKLAGYMTPAGQPVSAGINVAMNVDDPTADEVDDLIDQLNDELLAAGISARYSNVEQFTETISNSVAVFRNLFNFTALLMALVGAVGLLTTLFMSVFERQKEIGVMRSIGAGSQAIISQFLTEGMFVGVLAWLIGLPVSYFIAIGLLEAMDLRENYWQGYPLVAAVLGLAGMLMVTAVASIWPSLSAARKTVSDILRYQ